MNNQYFSDLNLSDRYGKSRATIWRWVHDYNFPKPIKLSPGCTRWKLSDIEKWEAEREARS